MADKDMGQAVPVRRLWVGSMVALGVALLLVWNGRRVEERVAPRIVADPAWAGLGPQARCESAIALVTQPDRWPMICAWREPNGTLQGQAFPPPVGPPPYDHPHIEIYVSPGETREQLASAIAHEFGHMHHTREPTMVAQYLAARNLPPDTPSEIWTEDYAEVFANLFAPPADRWRAPTPRPSPEALAALRARFFT